MTFESQVNGFHAAAGEHAKLRFLQAKPPEYADVSGTKVAMIRLEFGFGRNYDRHFQNDEALKAALTKLIADHTKGEIGGGGYSRMDYYRGKTVKPFVMVTLNQTER